MPGRSQKEQINAFTKDIQKMLDGFTKGPRKQILRKAAKPVRATAKALTPNRQPNQKSGIGLKPNPYYGRSANGKRSKRGKGNIKARYFRKNLERSIRVLPFRKSNDVFIGPRFGKKPSGEVGRTIGNSDGFYARMVYGSARAFYRRVLQPARDRNAVKVYGIIRKESRAKLIQFWIKRGRKAG